jgi:hypothetical protein
VQQTPTTTHTHAHGGSSEESSPESSPAERSPQADMETANALAQAKQAANPSRYNLKGTAHKKKAHKRKRPPPSRDDIFRSRKFGTANTATRGRTGCTGEEACLNPISKFLSNHQGFANALCFATPVKDEDEEDGDDDDMKEDDKHNDNNSMASEANTLNTCEDSMLLLDRKLAQMSQNQPPMPLFHDFKVNQNDGEGLRRIVDTDSHSSANLMKLWKESQQQQRLQQQRLVEQQQQQQEQQPQHEHQPGQPMQVDDPMDLDHHHISSTSSSYSSSSGDSNHGGFHGHQGGRGAAATGGRHPPAQPAIPEEDVPPPMKKSSTGSSSDSGRSARHRGEI